MLILQRKPGESIQIGDQIKVSVVSVDGRRVRLSIEAPTDISILRTELLETIEANQEAVVADNTAGDLLSLLGGVLDKKAPEKGSGST